MESFLPLFQRQERSHGLLICGAVSESSKFKLPQHSTSHDLERTALSTEEVFYSSTRASLPEKSCLDLDYH